MHIVCDDSSIKSQYSVASEELETQYLRWNAATTQVTESGVHISGVLREVFGTKYIRNNGSIEISYLVLAP